MSCERPCGECYWFDPENEINNEKGCCMRFLIHVEENTIADNCFRERSCVFCKHNIEYPPPHTCDVCTSLDQEPYTMWERM